MGKIQEIENLNRYGRQEVEDQIPQVISKDKQFNSFKDFKSIVLLWGEKISKVIATEDVKTAPQFVRPLPGNIGEIEEGTPLHLECQVVPLNDNTLSITWLREGKPIPTGILNLHYDIV